MIDSLLDWVEGFTGSPWFYVAIFVLVMLDSVIPVMPSEGVVVIGGIAAGQGKLSLTLVILVAAVGAVAGDNLAYWGARTSEGWMQRRVLSRARQQAQLEWATEQLHTRGAMLLVTARFIPGGRTAVTLAYGLTRRPYGRFLRADVVACVLWAGYAATLGFVFGERFRDNTWLAFLLALAAALSVTAVIEGVRWSRRTSRP